MHARLKIGVDLGGTKIEAIALNDDDQAVTSHRIPAPSGDYDRTITAISDLVRQIRSEAPGSGPVGIGMPGSISPATGLVQNANSVWLNGKPFKQDLEAALGEPVRLANDADCFALSEAHDGAGRDAVSVFGVILGTGCGGGFVLHDRLLRGPHAIGGEWGHTPLPWPWPDEMPGPQCWCGLNGCLETWISGPGLSADFKRHTSRVADAQAVYRAFQNGDLDARDALERYADRLARGLAVVVNITDPELIILGGGLSQIDELYAWTQSRIGDYVFADHCAVRIVPPLFGDASGVRGAARLWDNVDRV